MKQCHLMFLFKKEGSQDVQCKILSCFKTYYKSILPFGGRIQKCKPHKPP